jgi:hypothetical protein
VERVQQEGSDEEILESVKKGKTPVLTPEEAHATKGRGYATTAETSNEHRGATCVAISS